LVWFSIKSNRDKEKLTFYICFRRFKVIFPFQRNSNANYTYYLNKLKSTFLMIFENGLKKFDFARQNLDGAAIQILAHENENPHCFSYC